MSSVKNISDQSVVDVSPITSIKRDITDYAAINSSKDVSPITKDTDSISEISKYLSEEKVDISSSSANYDGKNLDFNLNFKRGDSETMTAAGSYNADKKELSFNLSYSFKRYVLVKGVMTEKPFEANIDFSSGDVASAALEQLQNKTDILEYLSNAISKLFAMSGNEAKSLSGKTFSTDDLINLAHIDDLKMAKLVKELVNVAIFTARLKQIIKEKASPQEDSITSIASSTNSANSDSNETEDSSLEISSDNTKISMTISEPKESGQTVTNKA